MKILGISCFYHDSAASIIDAGEVKAACQEERFSRIKNDKGFPTESIKYCLSKIEGGLSSLDYIAFYDKPLLKFERILETFYQTAPRGFLQFAKAIPEWLGNKIFLKRMIYSRLKEIDPEFRKRNLKILFPEHHLSHAASTFYPSGFDDAAILTVDGVGEWATTTLCHGKNDKIQILKEIHFPDSLGLFYSSVTYYLGFEVNSGEYKVMGLAPYGNRNSNSVKGYHKTLTSNLISVYEDGSFQLNQKYFSFRSGLRMVDDKTWERLLGFPRRVPEEKIEQHHSDLAAATQMIVEEIFVKLAQEAKKVTGSRNLCLAGGVALNCVANGRLMKKQIFDQIFITPASGDAGGSLGAALVSYHLLSECKGKEGPKEQFNPYLGPGYTDQEILRVIEDNNIDAEHLDEDQLYDHTVAALVSGKVVGWFQGNVEFGPRALGNRSILADPTHPEMQDIINSKIKFRESFRPFAPAVIEEEAHNYFILQGPSPYMLLTTSLQLKHLTELPTNYAETPMDFKRRYKKSLFPAITHVDLSSRLQTVNEKVNPRFYKLLKRMGSENGHPMLLNTSFNLRNEPIVCSPLDAYYCFQNCHMDILVLGNYFIEKTSYK